MVSADTATQLGKTGTGFDHTVVHPASFMDTGKPNWHPFKARGEAPHDLGEANIGVVYAVRMPIIRQI